MLNWLNFKKQNTSTQINLDDLKTKSFKKEDFYKTQTGLKNKPTSLAVITNLLHTSRQMQKIQDKIDFNIKINSAYRSLAVNTKVKGSSTSKHMQGLAIDFVLKNNNNEMINNSVAGKLVADACLINKILFDKILIESGCVHIQFQLTESLNQNFVGFADLINGKWIVKKA